MCDPGMRPVLLSVCAEEGLQAREVVGVDVVDVGGEQFAPQGVPLGSGEVGVAQNRTRCRCAWACATMARSFWRSAAGNGPAPSQLKLCVQLLLMSGMKAAVAAVPRSSRRPS